MPENTDTAATAESSARSASTPPLVSTRRVVLCGAGGAAALALAGCSSSGSSASGSSASGTGMAAGPSMGSSDDTGMGASGAASMGASAGSTASASGSASASASASGTGAGTVLGKAADVPVGGGTVFAAAKVVVTQTTAGQYKGFSAVCTHRGCTVSQVANGVIMCPCHGSEFKIEDGSVAKGPATSALAPVPVKTQNGTLVADV